MARMRRKTIAAIAALATVGSLAACSSGAAGGGKAENVSLTFLTFETPALGAKFWDASISRAEDATGVTVKKIISPNLDRTAYAKQLQASGQFPDVLSSITPKDFLDAGLLNPFDKAWLTKNFILPDATNIKGKAYLPPTNAQALPVVFYNKKIFADNNITVPTNYADFVAAIKKLRAAKITPLEMAGADGWSASMPLVALASADVLGKDPQWIQERYAGKVKFSDELFANAMKKDVDLVKMGAYSPTALSVDFPTANKNFLDGKSAMYPMGSWFTGSGYISPKQADNIGSFPWPTDDGSIVVPVAVGGTTSVSSKSKNADKAMEFAKSWSLDPENMKVLIESDGAFPMMKNIPFSDFHATVNSLYQSTFPLVAKDTKKVSAFGWVANDDSLAPGINDKFYALSQSFFSNADVKSQLAQLDKDWDAAAQ